MFILQYHALSYINVFLAQCCITCDDCMEKHTLPLRSSLTPPATDLSEMRLISKLRAGYWTQTALINEKSTAEADNCNEGLIPIRKQTNQPTHLNALCLYDLKV